MKGTLIFLNLGRADRFGHDRLKQIWPAIERPKFKKLTVPRRDSNDLVTLIAMAVWTLQPQTLANVARHLEGLHIRAPRGRSKWTVSSVQGPSAQAVVQESLLDRSVLPPEVILAARSAAEIAECCWIRPIS